MIVTLDHEVTFGSLELILFAMALLVSVLFGLYLPKYSVRESQPDPSRWRSGFVDYELGPQISVRVCVSKLDES